MEVKKFINEKGITALESELGIKIRDYPEHQYRVLNYDQIESPKAHPVVMECRSLILDYENNVISRTFDRFFNHGEVPEYYADFDISRAYVFEKADGSLTKVYWSPKTNRWELGTRSSAFAEVDHKMGGQFREWVLKAFRATEESFQSAFADMDKSKTYILEYTGPENRVVTPYAESQMVTLGIRDNLTGKYESIDSMVQFTEQMVTNGLNVRMVKLFDMKDFNAIVSAAENLPTLAEGYVCWDPVSDKRTKIKNPAYVAVHHLRENGDLSLKRVYALVWMNEYDEYLTYFPEDTCFFEPAIAKVEELKKEILEVWEKFKDIESQKDFALAVKDYRFSSVLFTARKQKISPLIALDNSSEQYKLGLVNL